MTKKRRRKEKRAKDSDPEMYEMQHSKKERLVLRHGGGSLCSRYVDQFASCVLLTHTM